MDARVDDPAEWAGDAFAADQEKRFALGSVFTRAFSLEGPPGEFPVGRFYSHREARVRAERLRQGLRE